MQTALTRAALAGLKAHVRHGSRVAPALGVHRERQPATGRRVAEQHVDDCVLPCSMMKPATSVIINQPSDDSTATIDEDTVRASLSVRSWLTAFASEASVDDGSVRSAGQRIDRHGAPGEDDHHQWLLGGQRRRDELGLVAGQPNRVPVLALKRETRMVQEKRSWFKRSKH